MAAGENKGTSVFVALSRRVQAADSSRKNMLLLRVRTTCSTAGPKQGRYLEVPPYYKHISGSKAALSLLPVASISALGVSPLQFSNALGEGG